MTEAQLLMTPGEVASQLGMTSAGVKLHDDELAPLRTATGRRLYLRSTVLAFAATRDQKRTRTK